MSDFNELIRTSVPFRPRQKSDIPVTDLATAFIENGFIVIPCYTSKKEENPEGFKLTSLKRQLINGHAKMSVLERTHVQGAFIDSYFTIIINKGGLKEMIVVDEPRIKELEALNYHVKKLIPMYKESSKDEPKPEVIPTPKDEPKSKDKPKGKPKKK